MRINVGGNQHVELVSSRDPAAKSFEKTLTPADLAWYVRGCSSDSMAVWQLRQLTEKSGFGSNFRNLSDEQVIDEAVRQVKSGWLVGSLVGAPVIVGFPGTTSQSSETVTASPPLPVSPAPRLTDKCNLAGYCEEQFRIAAKEGIARVDCPVLNGGACPT